MYHLRNLDNGELLPSAEFSVLLIAASRAWDLVTGYEGACPTTCTWIAVEEVDSGRELLTVSSYHNEGHTKNEWLNEVLGDEDHELFASE